MSGTNTAAIPFTVYKVVGGAGISYPLSRRLPQAATQTFNFGTPVSLTSGYLGATATITNTTFVIAGMSTQPGDSLTSSGTAPVAGAASFGSVPNQTAAVNVAIGSPMIDGNTGVVLASDEVQFVGCVDAAHTTAAADIGSLYGLTKDSTTGNWFVDTTITTTAAGACVEVMGFVDPVGTGLNGNTTTTTGGRVAFRVIRAMQQMFT